MNVIIVLSAYNNVGKSTLISKLVASKYKTTTHRMGVLSISQKLKEMASSLSLAVHLNKSIDFNRVPKDKENDLIGVATARTAMFGLGLYLDDVFPHWQWRIVKSFMERAVDRKYETVFVDGIRSLYALDKFMVYQPKFIYISDTTVQKHNSASFMPNAQPQFPKDAATMLMLKEAFEMRLYERTVQTPPFTWTQCVQYPTRAIAKMCEALYWKMHKQFPEEYQLEPCPSRISDTLVRFVNEPIKQLPSYAEWDNGGQIW